MSPRMRIVSSGVTIRCQFEKIWSVISSAVLKGRPKVSSVFV